MESIYMISVVTGNTLRVLQRIVGIVARQRLHIEQLNVFETKRTGQSYFNIVIQSDAKRVQRVVTQLQRIIELIDVKISSHLPLLTEEKYP